jgi:hypothetical protein
MSNIGDYIGQLMSEITIARMHADLEAVRIAELYAVHPLLRHMPVPHFRLPKVEMDIPIVIEEMEEQGTGELPRGTPTVPDMRKKFDGILVNYLKEENISLSSADKKKLNKEFDKLEGDLEQPREITVDSHRVADKLVSKTSRLLTKSGLSEPELLKIEEKLKHTARVEFLNLRKPPRRLKGLFTTTEVREAGSKDVIARFHLTISEEGVEMVTFESDGKKESKLVIE